uniref:G_PROTEIN_RECEP_F1_2 domain-containing protein n=1 Tax=Strongyloides papillosus TaxID=174720 RepID=A0A0N5C3K4_STREA
MYLQISLIIYSAIILPLRSTYCSLPYRYGGNKYFNGAKKGQFTCRYPFNYTTNDFYFIYTGLLHSASIIAIILTIIIMFKIKKLNKTSNEFSVSTIKKRNKERRMTRYVVLLAIVQLTRLIQDQLNFFEIKIYGYDESIRYINLGLKPFISILRMFINALSIIFISETLRDAVFKNLKLDIMYKKLFRENVIVPSSHNPNFKQNVNRETKKKIII